MAFAWSHFEAYLRTSGESNRHRWSVRDVKNVALPTTPQGRLPSVEPVRQDPEDVAMEGSTEGLGVDTEFARVTRLKRESEQTLPELEKETAEEVERSKPSCRMWQI